MKKTNALKNLQVAFLLLFSLSCSKGDVNADSASSNWSRGTGDNTNNGNITLKTTPNSLPTPAWATASIDISNKVSPLVLGDFIYTSSNKLLKINRKTGNTEGSIELNGTVTSNLTIDNNILYFGDNNKYFYAVDLATFKIKWSIRANGAILSTPLIASNIVFFGDTYKGFYALNINDGSVAWTKDLTGTESSPSFLDGNVYVGNKNGTLFCFEAKTGKEIWAFSNSTEIQGGPSITSEGIIFGNVNGGVYCVDKTKGTQKWQYKIDTRLGFKNVATNAKNVYLTCSSTASTVASERLICLDMKTGALVWEYKFPGSGKLVGSPIAVNDKILFGALDALHCVEQETGKSVWKYVPAGLQGIGMGATPTVVEGEIFYGAGGKLNGLKF
jgi:outer membrane protein assembly factor BamB